MSELPPECSGCDHDRSLTLPVLLGALRAKQKSVNIDGDTDLEDLAILLAHFGPG